MAAVKAFDVFVSYATEDKLIADSIVAKLEAAMIRCWIAPRDIPPGADWPAEIVTAIERSRGMVVVVSRNSVESKQVHREVGNGVNEGLFVIPFRIEDVELSKNLKFHLQSPHWLDAMTPPLHAHLSRLVDAVLRFLEASFPIPRPTPKILEFPTPAPPAVTEVPPDEWGRKKGSKPQSWFTRLLEEKE
ncbi:MAG: hypothetical protein MNPFHGCM_02759 [Gemmatimonadaceae bacterium]|nr:hypothetical protein [Gemmatimonadaceae bacterium]